MTLAHLSEPTVGMRQPVADEVSLRGSPTARASSPVPALVPPAAAPSPAASDGAGLSVEVYMAPIQDVDGSFAGVVATFLLLAGLLAIATFGYSRFPLHLPKTPSALAKTRLTTDSSP